MQIGHHREAVTEERPAAKVGQNAQRFCPGPVEAKKILLGLG